MKYFGKKMMVMGLMILVLVFSACGSKNSAAKTAEGEKKTITMMFPGAGDEPGLYEPMIKPVLEKYFQETGVSINCEFYQFNDYFQVIEIKIGSKSEDYDILAVDVPMVAGYVNRGYLASLDQYYSAEEKNQFVSSAVNASSWNGVFYAPPLSSSSQLLWYNKDLLNQAGITIRDSDVNNRLTYEEVTEYARQAVSKLDPTHTNGIAGIMFEQVSRTYQMNALPNSMGEKSIGDDGLTVDGIINTQGWIKSLTWYQNLYKDNLSLQGYNGDETGGLYISGKVVFLIGGDWVQFFGPLNFDYGYAPVPAFKGYENKVATPTGSWHIGINNYSKNKDMAAEFIKWITLGDGHTLWIEACGELASTKAAINKILNDPDADPIKKIANYEATNTAFPRALTPGYSEYSTIMDAMWEDVRNGSDIKNSLDNAVREINSALAKYK
jgi:ABC-type glycerol-3-phosphate transport system substrate-binding protein